LTHLDRVIAGKIYERVENHLAQDPINHGEPLVYDYQGLYRYRFSDYRVIYEIKETELIILVLKVAHRREVY
jgi:mRNA interferase RelE/StbE